MSRQFSDFLKITSIFVAVGIVSLAFSSITGRSACVFYNITGVPCPSCGMTRAFLCILKGDIYASLKYHPLFLAVPVIPVSFLFKGFPDKKRRVLLSFLIALFIFAWVIRLVLYFPHSEPFILNDKALIPVIAGFY